MIRWNFAIVVVISWAVLAQHAAANDEAPEQKVYSLMAVPWVSANLIMGTAEPVERFIAARSGIAIKLEVCPTYRHCAIATASGRFDFAFAPAPIAAYAIAHGRAIPLAREVGPFRTALFTRVDSEISSPADLRGQRVATVDPLSNSSSVWRRLLSLPGDAPDRPLDVYSPGPMDAVILEVLNGRAKAGIIGVSELSRISPPLRNVLVSIAAEQASIRSVVLAGERVPEAERNAVAKAWREFGQSEFVKGQSLDGVVPQYVPLDDADLAALAVILESVDGPLALGLPSPGEAIPAAQSD